MTSMPVTPCINQALPEEVLGVIFEEHAKLEWRAAVIDGLVCREWRRTILRSPRAWAHLEIGEIFKSAPSELRQQWLGRSGTVPLHIQVSCGWHLETLDQHHKRIEALTLRHNLAHFLLENHSFPILQSLTINDRHIRDPVFRWSTWDAMPALRSLRVSHILVDTLPSKAFPALRVLALSRVKEYDYVIQNSYHSLTTLMLDSLYVPDTSETLEFPSLRFLSLFAVTNLKHRMSVPALTTYHEGNITKEESFSMPLPLLTEYGIYQNFKPLFNVTRLDQCYPNLSRFSVRTRASSVKAFLHSLSGRPSALPMLRILAVGLPFGGGVYSREDKDRMRNAVFVRNMTTSVEMELCFDGKLRVPLYFGHVRVYIKEDRSRLTSTLRRRIDPIEYLSFVLGCALGL